MIETILLQLGALSCTVSISIAEMFLFLIIVSAGITLYKERDFSIFKKSYTQFFLLMIIAETLSAIFGYDPKTSFKSWSSFWVAFHLFCVYIIFDGKQREKVFAYFFGGVIITLLVSIYKSPHMGGEFRATGFYSHALTYGNMIALMLTAAIGMSLFSPSENKRMRWFIYFSGLCALIALMMSGSRGPQLSVFVTVPFMLIYKFRMKGVIIASVLAGVIILVVLSTPVLSGRFSDINKDLHKGSDTSVGTRLVLWEASSKAIMSKPLFGYGKGNFKPVISQIIDVPVQSMAHAHNSYIQYTFTNGFFGLFALFMFLSALFRHILRETAVNPYAKTALFILIVYLLEGLTENNFSDSEVVMSAFMSIALLIAPVRDKGYRLFNRS